MCKILLIETSASLTSVALSENGSVKAYRECTIPRSQASQTAPLIDEVLRACGLRPADLDAVALSSGPGSYTGLRVGSSTAKGLCFGAGVPLIEVCTLDILVAEALAAGLPEGCKWIIPMIDARRMEVYTAVYDPEGKRVSDICAKIIDSTSFSEQLADGPCVLVGDGAGKCRGVLGAACDGAGITFMECCPRADAMAGAAEEAFRAGRFADIAYFEPFYLKEFVATQSKKKLF